MTVPLWLLLFCLSILRVKWSQLDFQEALHTYSSPWDEGEKRIHQTGSISGSYMTFGFGISRTRSADSSTDCLLSGRDVKLMKALTLFLLSETGSNLLSRCCGFISWARLRALTSIMTAPSAAALLSGRVWNCSILHLLPALKTYKVHKLSPSAWGGLPYVRMNFGLISQQNSSCMVQCMSWMKTVTFAGMCWKRSHYQILFPLRKNQNKAAKETTTKKEPRENDHLFKEL